MQLFSARGSAAAVLCAWHMLGSAPVAAHAIVIDASPAVDAELGGPGVPVLLRFNSRIDRDRSRLTLIRPDGSGKTVPLAASTGPDTLAASIAGLAPGRYRLRWQVLGIDGHITRGDIPFSVAR
jgi:methionine-rich copper-binding protein CopC